MRPELQSFKTSRQRALLPVSQASERVGLHRNMMEKGKAPKNPGTGQPHGRTTQQAPCKLSQQSQIYEATCLWAPLLSTELSAGPWRPWVLKRHLTLYPAQVYCPYEAPAAGDKNIMPHRAHCG